jgi:hypothetical protein
MIRLVLTAAIAHALTRAADARRLPWCGFYMMHFQHKTGRRLALAREWAREGMTTSRPGAGVVVVWPPHAARSAAARTLAGNGWCIPAMNALCLS